MRWISQPAQRRRKKVCQRLYPRLNFWNLTQIFWHFSRNFYSGGWKVQSFALFSTPVDFLKDKALWFLSNQSHSGTYRLTYRSKNVISQERIGWASSNTVKNYSSAQFLRKRSKIWPKMLVNTHQSSKYL